MDAIWREMLEAARAVWNGRQVSEYVSCGEVAAAVRSKRWASAPSATPYSTC